MSTSVPSFGSDASTEAGVPVDRCLALLRDWARFAERDWYDGPAAHGLGCYGSGFDAWGVQTNQKYIAAMAVLATHGAHLDGVDAEWVRDRALTALRFNLRTHLSNDLELTDGSRWGHTWISSLGVERMMHGVALLEPYMDDTDRAYLRNMLASEADWQMTSHQRGQHQGVQGDPWGDSGRNNPESNIWVGCTLWRTAAMYPDHPHADDWRGKAHEYLINGVSVEADARDQTIVAGKPVRDRHVGPNLFPNFALDHHAYFNVGYMAICVSNAAMLHFDLKQRGAERPESLDHHQQDLWNVLRRFVFADGRLARAGGDSRVRYAYCQEYLMPALLYAADRFGDAHALGVLREQLGLIETEAAHNGDGGFYSRRLAWLGKQSPFYLTRLESDRACALGMAVAYGRLLDGAGAAPATSFEASVAGGWAEPSYGAALHRSGKRFASFAWRAHGRAQGMCLPPDDGHLAEWSYNLAGFVRFCDSANDGLPTRRVERRTVQAFDGGFLTFGALTEGVDIMLREGWRGTDSATHQLAIAALPDEATLIGLQFCKVGPHRRYLAEVAGLCLNVPNDLFNDFARTLHTPTGELRLERSADGRRREQDEAVTIDGRWLNVAGRIGVVGLYGGGAGLCVQRPAERIGGPQRSLFVERVCWPYAEETRAVDPGEVVLDAGWMALASVDPAGTRAAAEAPTTGALSLASDHLRGVSVAGRDGHVYALLWNVGDEPATSRAGEAIGRDAEDLVAGDAVALNDALTLAPGEARLLRMKKT